MQKKKTETSEEYYGELGKAFHFTQGDLEANRAGFMSFRQKQLQRKSLVTTSTLALVMIVIELALTTIFRMSAVIRDRECIVMLCDGFATDGRIQLFLFQLLCTSPFWLMILWAFFSYKKDMQTGRIEKFVSKLSVDVVSGKTISYYLVSPEHRFGISEAAYHYYWGEVPYTVYYLPNTKAILSIEAMEKHEAKAKKLALSEDSFGAYSKVFKFTQDDLETNRAGFVSEAQKKDIEGDGIGAAMVMMMAVAIIFACCAYILVYFIPYAQNGFVAPSRMQFAIFLLCLLGTVIIAFFGVAFFRAYSGFKQADINTRETIVQVYDGFEKYRQNSKVDLTDKQVKLLERYSVRIYAMPTTKRILSVEAVMHKEGQDHAKEENRN